jgi:hypothetical protein
MASSRAASALVPITAIVAIVAMAASPGCRRPAASGRIDIATVEVRAGLGGIREDGRPMPVLVRARTADGKVFRGEIEIAGIFEDGSPAPGRFRARFDAAGEMQAVEVPVLPRGWSSVAVMFRGEGIPEETFVKKLLAPVEAKLRVLVVEDRPGAVGPAPEAIAAILGYGSAQVDVARLGPADLPLRFLGYSSADLVVLSSRSVLGLDPDRLEPLAEWARRGGTVAALAGSGWSGKVRPEALALLGLRDPPRPVAADGAPPAKGERRFALDPAPGSRLLLDGLLLEGRPGTGRSFVIAREGPTIFSMEDPETPGSRDAWKPILDAARRERALREAIDGDLQRTAIHALSAYAGIRYPARSKVIAFIAAYGAVVFLIAGLVFARLRRLEWMYAIAVAIAIAASAGIWRYGLLAGAQEFGVDAVTVARVRPGSSIADAVTWVALTSPKRTTFVPGTAEDLPGALVPSQPFVEERRTFPLDFRVSGGRLELPEVPLLANAPRFLRFDGPIDLGGKIENVTKRDSRIPEVVNGTGHQLEISLMTADSWMWDTQESTIDVSETRYLTQTQIPALPSTLQHGLRKALSSDKRKGEVIVFARVLDPFFPPDLLGPFRHHVEFIVLEAAPLEE